MEEAEAFLRDRGLLTRTADCALPSLYEACHVLGPHDLHALSGQALELLELAVVELEPSDAGVIRQRVPRRF